jgi:protein-disulfide isomerase
MKSVMEASANVATLLACAVVVAFAWPQLKARWIGPSVVAGAGIEQVNNIRIHLPSNTVMGNVKAPVALIEFSDFQCPYCARYVRDTAPRLIRDFVESGKVVYGFRNYPLPIHASALGAGKASLCASQQGAFWPMHDLLFKNATALDHAHLVDYASELQLNRPAFQACLDDSDKLMAQDMDEARVANVTSTPTFFVGRITADGVVSVKSVIHGAYPTESFQKALEDALTSNDSATHTASRQTPTQSE